MRHSLKPKSIFVTYYRYPNVFLASATFVPEHTSVENTLNLEKFLAAMGANRKFVTAAFICLVCIYLCKNIHMAYYRSQN